MNNQYEEARVWYDENWPCCIRLDIDWSCRGYDYPEHVVEWIKNDTTNWRKLNDENGGTYEYFVRMIQRNHESVISFQPIEDDRRKNTVNLINYYP